MGLPTTSDWVQRALSWRDHLKGPIAERDWLAGVVVSPPKEVGFGIRPHQRYIFGLGLEDGKTRTIETRTLEAAETVAYCQVGDRLIVIGQPSPMGGWFKADEVRLQLQPTDSIATRYAGALAAVYGR